MGVLTVLYYLTIVLFPMGEIARFSLGNSVSITLNDFAIATLSVYWWIFALFHQKKLTFPFWKQILVFVCIAFFSLLVNMSNFKKEELFVASLYIFRFVAYTSILFVTAHLVKTQRKFIYFGLLFIGSSIILIGLVQYAYYQNLRNLFYLGWDDHLYRLFSSFLDPNFTGAFLVLFFIFLTTELLLGDKKQIVTNRFKKILLLLTLIALFLTHSRGALIALFIGSSVMFVLLQKTKLIALLLGTIVFVLLLLSPFFYIENVNFFRSVSTKARVLSFQEAVTIIKDHPILGVGFNTYRYTQIQYGFRKGVGALASHSDAGTDNSFLFLFATTGIVGLIAYLWLLRKIIIYSLQQSKQKEKKSKFTGILVTSSLVAMCVNSLFINALFFSFLMEWLWIIVGLLPREEKKETKDYR